MAKLSQLLNRSVMPLVTPLAKSLEILDDVVAPVLVPVVDDEETSRAASFAGILTVLSIGHEGRWPLIHRGHLVMASARAVLGRLLAAPWNLERLSAEFARFRNAVLVFTGDGPKTDTSAGAEAPGSLLNKIIFLQRWLSAVLAFYFDHVCEIYASCQPMQAVNA